MRKAAPEELTQIEGIGAIIAEEWCRFFADEKQAAQLDELLAVVTPEFEKLSGTALSGKTFVITGSVEQFANRNELKAFIEQRGGKVSGSVSAKTDYLINNDAQSNSSKNKTASEKSGGCNYYRAGVSCNGRRIMIFYGNKTEFSRRKAVPGMESICRLKYRTVFR